MVSLFRSRPIVMLNRRVEVATPLIGQSGAIDQFCSRVNIPFATNALSVVANRAGTEVENGCNFFRGLSLPDKVENLLFSSCQRWFPNTQHSVAPFEISQKVLCLCGHQFLPVAPSQRDLGASRSMDRFGVLAGLGLDHLVGAPRPKQDSGLHLDWLPIPPVLFEFHWPNAFVMALA